MTVLPRTQVLNSKTYKAPPLEDESLALPDLYDWHYENSPQHPLFTYEEAPGKLRTITWAEAVRAIHRSSYDIASRVPSEVAQAATEGRPIVIATLALTDTITYFTTEVGILRAGFTVFPISPRNSPEAIAHLLKKTGVRHLLIGQEPILQKLSAATLRLLENDEEGKALGLTTSRMPVFSEVYPDGSATSEMKRYPEIKFDLKSHALILHSSGSTSFPKPIRWDQTGLKTFTVIPWYGELDMCDLVMSCHAMPIYHGMGLLQLALVASCGLTMAVFKPAFPATLPNPQNVFEGIVATKCKIGAVAPTFLEVWSRMPEAVAYLKTMEAMMWGGGPLTKEVGDYLSEQGVIIHPQYGTSECGVMNTFIPKQGRGADWEYFTVSNHCRAAFIPEDDGTFEFVLIDHQHHHPTVLNTKVDGQDAYATSDLLIPHPTKQGLWKIYGRKDDQIMLSTGEKTNPGPLEGILCQDPHVLTAVMFGRGKFQNGVLIDPKPQFAFDPTDEKKLEAFRNAIWPTVERMNEFAPQHSRLFKEMIVVAKPSKPFQYTAKMTARRQAIIKDYDEEIAAVYAAVDQSSQTDIPTPTEWTPTPTLAFVQQTVNKVMKQNVADDADVFLYGCDSLQATWIRNSILRALRETAPEVAKRLPTNFVYDYPTKNQMVGYICKAVLNPTMNEKANIATRGKELQAVVNRLTKEFPERPQDLVPVPAGETYLLSGSTGGLGSNILAQLLTSDKVVRVYVFNRPSSMGTSEERHKAAFEKRGLDAGLLSSRKLKYVEGDFSELNFGIEPEAYNELRTSVTHIIHNAWRVNLNLGLTSFESNVVGVRNLIDFALTSPHADPPRLLFVSSIAVFINFDNQGYVKEEVLDNPEIAVGPGYSESKWISERILDAAAERTTLRPVIARLGQVCGDVNGYWNESEWFPSMVKSAFTVKCLPNLEGLVSWITAPSVASTTIEMTKSPYRTLHIAHPRAVPFTSLITPIAKELGVPLVPYEEWVKALEDSMNDTSVSLVDQMLRNPALRLIDFYRAVRVGPNWEPVGVARLGTENAVKVSETLREGAAPLGEENAHKWLAAWRKTRFLL
ncbi:acetyl-CoA synthetase-like protein [Dentipellis sp. KUC8613]|nr:acetyl-CoA synthetase-like protein [Dentipellis sp. KUC8613]